MGLVAVGRAMNLNIITMLSEIYASVEPVLGRHYKFLITLGSCWDGHVRRHSARVVPGASGVPLRVHNILLWKPA